MDEQLLVWACSQLCLILRVISVFYLMCALVWNVSTVASESLRCLVNFLWGGEDYGFINSHNRVPAISFTAAVRIEKRGGGDGERQRENCRLAWPNTLNLISVPPNFWGEGVIGTFLYPCEVHWSYLFSLLSLSRFSLSDILTYHGLGILCL